MAQGTALLHAYITVHPWFLETPLYPLASLLVNLRYFSFS